MPPHCCHPRQICRNYFGAQKSSFEVPLDTSKLKLEAMGKKSGATAATGLGPYPAVFIRAPAVLEVRRTFLNGGALD